MIWYDSYITDDVRVVGLYNALIKDSLAGSIIEIIVIYKHKYDVLYSHNPTMRNDEDPSVDQIMARYQTKLAKILSSLRSKIALNLPEQFPMNIHWRTLDKEL